MPRPSQEDKILAAALSCFSELGYDATRIKHIAARAGVSEGALYRHYPSKEAMAQALYRQYLGEYAAQLGTIVVAEGAARNRLRDAIRLSLASYRANPAALTFVLLRQPTFMGTLPAEGIVYPLDLIEGVVRDGQRDGSIRDGQPNLLAAIFLGCLLRPLIVSQLAQPGALDLLHDTRHDQTIGDAAWAAIAHPQGCRGMD
jgi:AcrR family transcriptional regulator